MYINVRKEMDFSDFERECWSDARFTLARIAEEGKEEEFINLLKSNYYDFSDKIDNAPTLTEINDLLRFDDNWVLEQLDIDLIKRYDIDDLDGEAYYKALENYLNDFAAYDEEGEELRRWLWDNVGSSATEWSVAVIRRLKEEINENGIKFDIDGNIIDDQQIKSKIKNQISKLKIEYQN